MIIGASLTKVRCLPNTRLAQILRDLFHVYLNKFEFQFLRLHINNTIPFCFFMHNGHVPGIAK